MAIPPSKTQFIKSYSDPAQIPPSGLPQVVFLGRSNAGKSSLINSLTGIKQLARVSSMPGRTRLINVFEVAGLFQLIDVPGYGYAKGSHVERERLLDLISEYLRTSTMLRLAVLIIDSRLGPTESDKEMMEHLTASEIPFVVIANKVDKLSRTQLIRAMSDMQNTHPDVTFIPHSSISGVGRGELLDVIRKSVSKK